MAVKVEVFEKEALVVSLAKYVADLSNKFTQQRGAFTVCLSGGSLINYLRKLSESPYVGSIEWGKWHVFWVDERVVQKDHEDSNYKLAFDGFLSKGYLEIFVCTSSAEFSMLCSDVKVIGYGLPLRMTFAIEGSVELLLQVHRLHQFCNQFLAPGSGLVS
ncbi:hypothetical protein KIW84_055568 [Lathyrus oleraceus]|uniref:Glucosamine/galactosamine-6-phosphate isomerase domain-containing protein n=1 Tax=Pisum sativum TaxID=3888 RepID=A0A9D4WYZ9_PEA|nr:hypothetical protein KIW84_055568 [Pisum sativum]